MFINGQLRGDRSEVRRKMCCVMGGNVMQGRSGLWLLVFGLDVGFGFGLGRGGMVGVVEGLLCNIPRSKYIL